MMEVPKKLISRDLIYELIRERDMFTDMFPEYKQDVWWEKKTRVIAILLDYYFCDDEQRVKNVDLMYRGLSVASDVGPARPGKN